MAQATLEDLYLEAWFRRRNSGLLVWTTRDGKQIPIKDMSDSHIANAINLFEELQEKNAEIMDHIGDMDPMDYYD